MPDDEPTIEPGASSRDDPKHLEHQERNVFYATLAPHAKEKFLEALERAEEKGLSEQDAWREAVVAAETAYPEERVGRHDTHDHHEHHGAHDHHEHHGAHDHHEHHHARDKRE